MIVRQERFELLWLPPMMQEVNRPGFTLSDSHILVDFLAHIPCELSTVLDGLEIGPA